MEYNPQAADTGRTLIQGTQTSWVRFNGVLWGDMQPSEPASGDASNVNWSAASFVALQDQLIYANSLGITPIVIVRKTPSWAQALSGYSCGPIRSDKMTAFGNFMRALVARLKDPPYNVKYWSFWNEEDVDYRFRIGDYDSVLGCWGNWDDAYYGGARYADALYQFNQNVKAVDSQAKVVIGSMLLPCAPANITAGNVYCAMSNFFEGVLRQMRDAYGGYYFDGAGFNAYDYFDDADPTTTRPPYWNRDWNSYGVSNGTVAALKAQFLKSKMSQYGAAGKSLFNMESALVCQYEPDPNYPTDPNKGSPWCKAKNSAKPYDASLREDYEIGKAFYAPKVFAQMMAEGVDATIWYNLKNNSVDTPPVGWFSVWTTGLAKYDGTPQYAYTAYKYASQQLSGASFVRRVTDNPNAFVYEFTRPGRKLWVAWSEKTGGTTLSFPTVPLTITNGFFTLPAPTRSFALDTQPVYVEWPAAAAQDEPYGPPSP